MGNENLTIPYGDLQKLLAMASADAALLYLYLQSGGDMNRVEEKLHMQPRQAEAAAAVLRQLGLWQEARKASFQAGERPRYSETDVMQALEQDNDFQSLQGEVQRQLGRFLSSEDLKILLGFTRYLGLGNDVISMLVSYCRERARRKGNTYPLQQVTHTPAEFFCYNKGKIPLQRDSVFRKTTLIIHRRVIL